MSTEIVMFTSPSCSACKTMKPIIESLPNARISDVTEEPEFAMRMNVRGGLPVFIKTKDGVYDDRLSGAVSEQILRRWAAK